MNKKDLLLPVMVAIAMIAAFSYLSEGYSLIFTFVPAVPIAFWLYYKTCYLSFKPKAGLIPLYLVGLGFQLIHFAEEHQFGFERKFGPLFGGKEYNHNLFVDFNMFAYFLFLLGAVGLYRNIKPLMFIGMFFIVYGMFGNAIGHITYCVMVRGYFPGIVTCFFNFLLTPVIVTRLWKLR